MVTCIGIACIVLFVFLSKIKSPIRISGFENIQDFGISFGLSVAFWLAITMAFVLGVSNAGSLINKVDFVLGASLAACPIIAAFRSHYFRNNAISDDRPIPEES